MVLFETQHYGGSVAICVYFSFAGGLDSTMDGIFYSRITPGYGDFLPTHIYSKRFSVAFV